VANAARRYLNRHALVSAKRYALNLVIQRDAKRTSTAFSYCGSPANRRRSDSAEQFSGRLTLPRARVRRTVPIGHMTETSRPLDRKRPHITIIAAYPSCRLKQLDLLRHHANEAFATPFVTEADRTEAVVEAAKEEDVVLKHHHVRPPDNPPAKIVERAATRTSSNLSQIRNGPTSRLSFCAFTFTKNESTV
jgi:hypothetical protein